MKHSLSVTLILLGMFLLAQFIGLGIIYSYIDPVKSAEEGKTVFQELPIGERPPIEEKTSFLPIMLAVLIGTGILLLLLKYDLQWIWKLWFLIAVVTALVVAFAPLFPSGLALGLSLFLGVWKIFRPNFWVHTFTELFIYGGLAAIFVPIFNLSSVIILLVLIAAYDAYAVWKSKHMITLAKSQTKAKMFAGLLVPYRLPSFLAKKVKEVPTPKRKVRTAVLGGGDVGFPLIFAGVILKELGLWQSLVIPWFALLGLAILLWKADEKKFYPAMPFIAAGCFLGLGIVWVISFLF